MIHQLNIDSVVKSYNNKTILSDIALSCTTGDIVAILGRNGSGKSTLLKIIFGLIPTENSYIAIDNKKLTIAYAKQGNINYLPQQSFIPAHFSIQKVANLFLDKNEQVAFFEDDVIQALANKKIKELAYGDKRYVEIKLILTSTVKFSLLDEPFTGLSPIYVEKINTLLTEAKKTRGIILIDHEYETVLALATKLYMLQNSNLIAIENRDALAQYNYIPNI